MWQQYYEPQIAARNRWAERSHPLPEDLAPHSGLRARSDAQVHGVRFRARLTTVGAAAGSAAVAVLGVLGMHAYRAEPPSAGASSAQVVHSAPDATTAAAGSGIAE